MGVGTMGLVIMGLGTKGLCTRLTAMKSSKLPKGSDDGPAMGLETRELSWKLPKFIAGGLAPIGLATREWAVPKEPKYESLGLFMGLVSRFVWMLLCAATLRLPKWDAVEALLLM